MTAVAVRSGRVLQLGPAWSDGEATLAFDAASGDYWVLDAVGRLVIACILDGGARSLTELASAIAATPALAHAGVDLPAVLEGLAQAGLLQSGHPASV